MLPAEWRPGLMAVVEWEKDPDPMASRAWPEPLFSDARRKRLEEHSRHYTHHRAVVEIPRYGQEFCAIQVHFLPCDQVQVDTTCFTPQHPDYPYKELFQNKEATECPGT